MAKFWMLLFATACAPAGSGPDADDDDGDGLAIPERNVAACQAWLDDIACGSWDPKSDGSVDCSAYGELSCNVSPYFNCLSDETECIDDVVDISGWGDCASEAECT
jgi:hypothetical protein